MNIKYDDGDEVDENDSNENDECLSDFTANV